MSAEAASDDHDEDAEALAAALAMSMETNATAGPGLPADFQGKYELFALVTHKGRSADGGHYIGWSRQDGDDWLVFNDGDVSECKTENVMSLRGGGDEHMA